MTFVRGGDLFMHLQTLGSFLEDEVKYIMAQLVMAIGYLHSYNIVYRDLKLENILINDNGYISLVDFGISKQLESDSRDVRTYSVRGTPEYLAPEILNQGGHSFPVDWWALGTIAFEMLVGVAPFFEEDQSVMFKRILKQKLEFPEEVELSDECKDFIDKLLYKDPAKRLGNGGYQEILQHPFFKEIDFNKLLMKELDIPYKPTLSEDMFDVSNFEKDPDWMNGFMMAKLSTTNAERK
jgi:serum/glucocorticoid-regulated kinase 2